MIEAAVRELKDVIVEHDGTNAARGAFARRVDELINVFYDDIGEITQVSTRNLFDLFVIKVLYVERNSTDAGVIEYLDHPQPLRSLRDQGALRGAQQHGRRRHRVP